MTTETLPVNRHALIRVKAEDAQRLARYLPSNYHIALNFGTYGEGILIEGHDVAGWTLDDYVLPRLMSGGMYGSEVFYCATCGSHDHNLNDCPEEVQVFAVRVDGEEYQLVAHDRDELRLMDGTHPSYGQCQNCGSFDSQGDITDYTIAPALPDRSAFHAVCNGCGRRYPIVLKRSKEVCF